MASAFLRAFSIPRKVHRIVVAIVLIVPIVLLLRTGLYFLIDPGNGAAGAGLHIETAAARSHVRVTFGGFHLAIASVMAAGLLHAPLRVPVLLLMSLFMTVVATSRLLGIALDGYDPRELLPLIGETVTLASLLIGLAIEYRSTRGA